MRVIPRYAFAATAWLFAVGVLIQALLAGAGLFEWFSLDVHRGFGYIVAMLVIPLGLFGLLSWPDRRTGVLTVLLFGMAFVQPTLVYAKDTMPAIAALHPVNALLMFWLAIVIGRRALGLARASVAETAASYAPARASSARAQPSERTEMSAANAATTSTAAAAMDASRSPD
jgi:hypothetical protein